MGPCEAQIWHHGHRIGQSWNEQNSGASSSKSHSFGYNRHTRQYRLARFFVRLLVRLCQFDSQSLHQQLKRRYTSYRMRRTRARAACLADVRAGKIARPHVRPTQPATSDSTALWPRLILLLYAYLTLKFLTASYYLTMKHSFTSKMAKLVSEAAGSAVGFADESSNVTRVHHQTDSKAYASNQLAALNESLTRVDWMLDRLGSPYEEQPLIACAAYLITLNVTFISFLIPQLYYNYISPLGFFIVDLLDDEAAEFEHCKRLVDKELGGVASSSRSWIASTAAQIETNWRGRLSDHADFGLHHWKRVAAGKSRHSWSPEHRHHAFMQLALQQHETVVRTIEWLAAADTLTPINRSAGWFEKMLANFNRAIIGNLVYSFIFDMALAFGLPHLANVRLHLDLADTVALVELLILAQFSVLTTSLGVGLCVSHIAEQAEYILKLDHDMGERMKSSDRHFADLLRVHGQWQRGRASRTHLHCKIELCAQQLNAALIESLLRYRIYAAQLRPVLDSLSLIVLVALDLTIVMPVIMRCYAPYVMSNALPFGLGCSATFIVYADILLFPLCKFHQKGGRIYKRLWSALASAIEVNAISSDTFGRDMYAEPSVAMLRKELDHPAEVSNQFVAALLGLKATFPNLVELHFYYGIIMISLYLELESWRLLLGHRLDDPLNLL